MTEKPIRGNYKGGIISNLRYPTLDNYLISGGMSREGGRSTFKTQNYRLVSLLMLVKAFQKTKCKYVKGYSSILNLSNGIECEELI